MPELAYLNGKIMPIEKAYVPIEDRGYQFGDAVYEYIASHDGKLFGANEHLLRLERSMSELLFPKVSLKMIEKAVDDLFKKSKIKRAGIYIQISRGISPRLHGFSNKEPVQIVMTIKELPKIHPFATTGASAISVEDYRWGRCDIKTVQLLPNCLSKQKAVDEGAYDAIFISKKNIVREATSSNVFMIKNSKVLTHPLTNNILPGITRKALLEICRDQDITFEENFFTLEQLYDADEVFLSGTTTEVLPIIKLDSKDIADNKPGVLNQLLLSELRKRAGVKQIR